MIIELYGLCFAASMIFLVLLAVVGQRQNITNFLLLFVANMIINLGYFTISIAPSLIVAIRGNNLVYLGSVFTPMLLFLSVVKLCRRHINHAVSLFLLLFAGVILFYSFQIGFNTAFYSEVSLVEKNGVSFLEKEYGPMHALFPAYLALCMVFSLWTLLRSWYRRENVSWKVILGLSLAALWSVGCYVGKRAFHSDIEWTPFGYLADELLILFLIRRIGMYEVSDSIARALEEHSAYGYLIFDKKRNYLGCNDKAKEYLPETANLRIDCAVSKDAAFLYENVAEKLEVFEEQKPGQFWYISRDGKELRCSVRFISWKRKTKCRLYCIDRRRYAETELYPPAV